MGTLGNLARNAVKGPSTWGLDLSLWQFQFKETQRLELRAEAYNLTNSFRAVDPNPDVSNSNFGLIRDSREPRIMQFALKYVF